MKRRLSTILFGVVFIAGLSLLLYPTVSDYWNSFHQSRAIASYVDAVDNTDEQKLDEMRKAAQAYNEKLLSKQDRYEMSDQDKAEYESLLDVSGTGVMGYVEIPSINVSLPIYHGTDNTILQIGVGHIEGTSLPLAEQAHIVLFQDTGDLRRLSYLRILTRWRRGTHLSCMCLARH